MAKIIRSSMAERDLAEIWTYIARENLNAADKLLGQIDEAFDRIAATPQIGFAVENKPGVRCKPVKRNYLIFYKEIADEVFILRVVHGARRWQNLV